MIEFFTESGFTSGLSAVVVVDSALSRSRTRSAQVTQSPVESGVDLSDHVGVEPARYDFEGFLSVVPADFELPAGPTLEDRLNLARSTLNPGRPEDALERMMELMENGERLTVRESVRNLDGLAKEILLLTPMVLTSIEDRRAAPGSLEKIVIGSLQQVRVAFTREGPPLLRRSKRHTAPRSEQGVRSTTPASPEKARKSSLIVKGIDAVF